MLLAQHTNIHINRKYYIEIRKKNMQIEKLAQVCSVCLTVRLERAQPKRKFEVAAQKLRGITKVMHLFDIRATPTKTDESK